MSSSKDEDLLHSKDRFRDDCIHFSWTIAPDKDDGYFGQGDYHRLENCKMGLLKHLDVYTALYAEFICPPNCLNYVRRKE